VGILIHYICPKCGNVLPIITKYNNRNLCTKRSYCFNCKKLTNQIGIYKIDILEKELEFKDNLTDQEQKVFKILKNRDNNRL